MKHRNCVLNILFEPLIILHFEKVLKNPVERFKPKFINVRAAAGVVVAAAVAAAGVVVVAAVAFQLEQHIRKLTK